MFVVACFLIVYAGSSIGSRVSEYSPRDPLKDYKLALLGDPYMTSVAKCYQKICLNITAKPFFTKETQTWQDVGMRDAKLFSAFAERRSSADGPSVRVIANGLQEEFNHIGDLYCQMWYENGGYPAVVRAKYVRIYPSYDHHDEWVAHFVLCPMAGSFNHNYVQDFPFAVSVTPTPCSKASNALMVLNIHARKNTNTHALCLPPLYNYFRNWTMLVEMFELHKLMGAQGIYIYTQTVSKDTASVLRYYATERVTTITWNFPNLKAFQFSQRAALNDCLYRAGHLHRYVTVSDVDEVLVPRAASTWPELMRKIASPRYGAYLFQHVYFRRNNTGERPYLITHQSKWRTDKPQPPGKIRCKAMYDSENAISIDIHFPYELVYPAREYLLPAKIGLLHHYRATPTESFAKDPQRYQYVEDDYMLLYQENLTMRYINALSRIRGVHGRKPSG